MVKLFYVFRLRDNIVYEAVLLGFVGAHVVIAVRVFLDSRDTLAGIFARARESDLLPDGVTGSAQEEQRRRESETGQSIDGGQAQYREQL